MDHGTIVVSGPSSVLVQDTRVLDLVRGVVEADVFSAQPV
jgi:hypothetical protein